MGKTYSGLKEIIEIYGCIINVSRKNNGLKDQKSVYIDHTIYCLFPSFFKIII
jgi:hypothetical protein